MESCISDILEQLLCKEYIVIVRPHPEFIKRFPDKMDEFLNRYREKENESFLIQMDFSSSETVYQSDLLISDWSSIASEFSFATGKPTLFIDTPMKIMNPEYEKLGIAPFDITSRNILGRAVSLDSLDSVADTVAYLLLHAEEYKEKIMTLRGETIFHFGRNGEIGGEYIIKALAKKRKGRKDRL